MFRKSLLILVLAAFPTENYSWGQTAGFQGKEVFVPGEILIRLKGNASFEKRAKALAAVGAPETLGHPDMFKVKLKKNQDVQQALDQMKNDPAVIYAQPNYRYYSLAACGPPSDTFYAPPTNWPFLKIQAPQAWALFGGCPGVLPGNSVTVAVLDSGVSRNHPDLKTVPWIGYNAVNAEKGSGPITDSAAPLTMASDDDFAHGTFVAGIIAGNWGTNNSEPVCSFGGGFTTGVAGLAPGATLLAVKVMDSTGTGDTASVILGTNYAVAHGAKVLNFSLGSLPQGGLDPGEQDALDNALANNCVIVASSGNHRPGETTEVFFPAAYPPVLSVGATDQNDNVAVYSNFGPGLKMVAPGGAGSPTGNALSDSAHEIFSSFLCPLSATAISEGGFETAADGNFGVAAGTSASAPFVTAAAALVFSMYPGITNTQVVQRLINNADSLNGNQGWDSKTGYGRLDVYRALLNTNPDVMNFVKTFNSPNPFYVDVDLTTNITLAITQAQPVELTIYDSAGEAVLHKNYAASDLNNNPSNPQFKSFYIPWDGRNGNGQKAKTGVYIYTVKTGTQVGRNKIALIQGSK